MTDHDLEIRPIQPAEFDSVMGLVSICYGDDAEPPEWWRWRHFDPFLKTPEILAAFDGGSVVGMRPMSLFPFTRAGQPQTGAVFSAVMVHPDYRRRGLFSTLVSAGTEEAWRRESDFITTMPNDLSSKAYQNLDWLDPGFRTLVVLPFDFRAIARSRRLPGWIGEVARSVSRFTRKGVFREARTRTTLISKVEVISEDADDLADRICGEYEGLILHRTSRWWNWRFRANPWRRYDRFEARQADGCLGGVLVTAVEERHGLSVGYVADLLGEGPDVRRELIHRGARTLSELGAHVVVAILTDEEVLSEFCSLGFSRVPNRISPKKFRTMYLPNPASEATAGQLRNIRNWYQMLGDWDGI